MPSPVAIAVLVNDFSAENQSHGGIINTWILVTSNQDFLQSEKIQTVATPLDQGTESSVLWTDDFSSLFDVLR